MWIKFAHTCLNESNAVIYFLARPCRRSATHLTNILDLISHSLCTCRTGPADTCWHNCRPRIRKSSPACPTSDRPSLILSALVRRRAGSCPKYLGRRCAFLAPSSPPLLLRVPGCLSGRRGQRRRRLVGGTLDAGRLPGQRWSICRTAPGLDVGKHGCPLPARGQQQSVGPGNCRAGHLRLFYIFSNKKLYFLACSIK